MSIRSALLLLAVLSLSACGHRGPLTAVTTRQNGTIKLCGKVERGGGMVRGKTAEGSRVSINKSDIVTMDENGHCKR